MEVILLEKPDPEKLPEPSLAERLEADGCRVLSADDDGETLVVFFGPGVSDQPVSTDSPQDGSSQGKRTNHVS
jgi:hypothetical protein